MLHRRPDIDRPRIYNIQFLDNPQIGLFELPSVQGAAGQMSQTLQSPRHEALRAFIVEKRKKAGLTQSEVAAKLGRYQSFVANIESGQRRIDVVELLDLAAVIGFDPREAIKRLKTTGSKA